MSGKAMAKSADNVKLKEEKQKGKGGKPKEKKPNKLAKKSKETMSELKKVSWPKPLKVVKETSVVLAVVVIFAAVLLGVERLLSFLFRLLI